LRLMFVICNHSEAVLCERHRVRSVNIRESWQKFWILAAAGAKRPVP
jgi:hypothetical protein